MVLVEEKRLSIDDLGVMDIKIGGQHPNVCSKGSWGCPPGGVRLSRGKHTSGSQPSMAGSTSFVVQTHLSLDQLHREPESMVSSKVVQISDIHIVTVFVMCKDATEGHAQPLPTFKF